MVMIVEIIMAMAVAMLVSSMIIAILVMIVAILAMIVMMVTFCCSSWGSPAGRLPIIFPFFSFRFSVFCYLAISFSCFSD